jgi:hypothetical protein
LQIAKSAGGIDYTDPVDKVPDIGKKAAQFFNSVSINPKTIHCIGHSLGNYFYVFIYPLK